MSLARVMEYYDRVADAPDAVEKLRRFVLELAVRGKLVERNPKTSVDVRSPSTSDFGADATSYAGGPVDTPPSWRRVMLGDVIELVSGQHLQPNEYREGTGDGIPYITGPSDFGALGLESKRTALVRKAVARKGQLLVTVKGSGVGKTAICDLDVVAISRQLMAIEPRGWSFGFLRLVMSSIAESLNADARSLIPGISRSDIEQYVVAMPPVAEQHRIVAKVDELMALCDQLEVSRAACEAKRERFTVATFGRLTSADSEPSQFREDARFALESLAPLTMKPEQLADLRTTILGLAVSGRLVATCDTDEAVDVQLDASDARRQSTARVDRRADEEPQDLLHPELRWSVPPHWRWRGLADLALFVDYRGKTPHKIASGVRLVTAKNVRRGFLSRDPEEFISEEEYALWMRRGLPAMGDVLFTTEAPMGNAAPIESAETIALAQRVICLRQYGALNPRFFVMQLLSEPFQRLLGEASTGLTAKGIKAAKLKRLPIAIPPLEEQRRIVESVDALLSLCDQLGRALSNGDSLRRELLHASLAAAL